MLRSPTIVAVWCSALALSTGTGAAQDISDRRAGLGLYDWSGPYIGAAGSTQDNDSGAGLFAGYRYDFGRSVLGAEIDAGQVGARGEGTLRFKATAGAERGLGVYYGTAGIAVTEASPGNENNFFMGFGVDLRLNDHVSVGGEILYDNFNDIRSSTENPVAAAARVIFNF